ncbi:hypothetical protein R6Q57_001243 [Mikania cordata]
MSDGGGGESSNEIESHLKKKRRKNGEFAQAIARIAVTQVCESVGFKGFQQSALDTLSNVACKYIHEIGKTSGIPSAITEETQIQPDKIDQEHKILESLSSKLEPLQTHNETLFPVILEQVDISGRDRLCNPFLAVTLQPGEKEISVISLPTKVQEEDMVQNNLYHVCEVDALENEGDKIRWNEIVESVRNDILNNRHAVEMKFHIAKKSLDVAKAASWFLNDEEEYSS